jgi:hypothetical protein
MFGRNVWIDLGLRESQFNFYLRPASPLVEDATPQAARLKGAYMPISIEERLARIEAYLHKRYLYLKEKPRTSFEEMELLKEFGFDEPPKA